MMKETDLHQLQSKVLQEYQCIDRQWILQLLVQLLEQVQPLAQQPEPQLEQVQPLVQLLLRRQQIRNQLRKYQLARSK
jgi:hypothetical protein